MDTLGKRIAYLRNSRKLTQRKLMDILKFENLGKFETGGRKPNCDILMSIADYFDVSTDWLLYGKEKVNSNNSVEENKEDYLYNLHVTDDEMMILNLYRQLNERDKIKIEGMLEFKISEYNELEKHSPSDSNDKPV
ncbi:MULTISPECIES: helix-turn-helix domain-containing protein [unclassified Clostridioides]|uniref:helix-turn-helix domain-containing protein n=1 Tax=unclassified Clostridioides TaxID=2635829 RepID=UPI001D114BB7|nr:transcriptional regulator [Clostridioides sp. ZZV14-6150]MCC0659619.1 transcriptional regulator [Clostridioides sp. ZZV14-6154]MCC0666870.1 transcriptional regulator [Clostridioides sp. ZZV14-6153]MCC0719372.1 transcriptional regulator [Clostridioides sp. ZZV14-6105]MCC0722987.1 transcriptional regulator [Clostridioides sp. ZZV14-6104]MCC0725827.1 transcriptional regulator [Clostridioides sp. ZZV14-6045]MCC0729331.1 transcriptional regulator [Clostridioides sp. ZZV14-6048]MCC0733919.1 tra